MEIVNQVLSYKPEEADNLSKQDVEKQPKQEIEITQIEALSDDKLDEQKEKSEVPNLLAEMESQTEVEHKPMGEEVANCLALTVRKEYKLTIVKNVIGKGIKVSWKIALSILVMNFLNSFL